MVCITGEGHDLSASSFGSESSWRRVHSGDVITGTRSTNGAGSTTGSVGLLSSPDAAPPCSWLLFEPGEWRYEESGERRGEQRLKGELTSEGPLSTRGDVEGL
uniref:Uncharacterized protein n=1 Tax=Prymnesium polylepis TaxID=72548 RepID=A0A7S4MU73_9EUKA|mmetsp:Transcript_36516/g.91233  ORF Transcript_36516/g.91233 Transcript_36516/m.91233 type:complete len:103 (+) Transcript_36516:325-633(+)